MIISKNMKKRAVIALCIYILCLVWVIALKCNMTLTIAETRYLMGKMTLAERFTYSMSILSIPDASDAVVNLILFLPVGLMAPFIFDRGAFLKTVAISAILSAGFEVLQIIDCVGFFTYSDIAINTFGGLIGGALHLLFRKRASERITSLAITAYTIISSAIAAFGIFNTIRFFDVYITNDLSKYL